MWSWLEVFVVVAMDGNTSMVGDGPRHGGGAVADACGRVVAQDRVQRLAVFSSATEDEDLAVTHRHATALLRGDKNNVKKILKKLLQNVFKNRADAYCLLRISIQSITSLLKV